MSDLKVYDWQVQILVVVVVEATGPVKAQEKAKLITGQFDPQVQEFVVGNPVRLRLTKYVGDIKSTRYSSKRAHR